ncbi:Rha family transcriptional regulator [Celeribacter sp. SCSIO 80788]|uniref:Rha family transcriptional regulator n=1 Tax=Celeribacter sp. SCSIO 80788 TaxID=3117013 RepID=UPI003DA3474F
MNMAVKHDDFNGLVSESLKTTSRIIAEKFEKNHRDVSRAIKNLIEQEAEWGARNFAQTPYVDGQNGQTYQMYEMTRDGYSMLVMGFTGKKAMEWKIKFLAAFNAMEQRLKAPVVDLNDPAQLVPLLSSYAQRTQVAEAKVLELEPKAEAYDRLDSLEGALSVRPAAKVLGVKESHLIKWLQLNRWAFRQNGHGPLQAYVEKRNTGYLDHKLGEYTARDGDLRVSITLMITPKGMKRLAQIFAKEGGAQ